MADTVLVGTRLADAIAPQQIFRLSIYSTGLLSAIANWAGQVKNYVAALPSTGLGFVLGGETVDPVRKVAVLDFRVTTVTGASLVTVGDMLRAIQSKMPGAAIDRVTRIDGNAAVIRNRELELQGAGDRDDARDAATGWRGFLADLRALFGKIAFGTFLVVLALGLLAFVVFRKGGILSGKRITVAT